ncbi:MAG TPA: S41 family peptidase [Phycisphaerales bacterium]|nr:S41 family peptidase [Phycisphaerales bacterium]
MQFASVLNLAGRGMLLGSACALIAVAGAAARSYAGGAGYSVERGDSGADLLGPDKEVVARAFVEMVNNPSQDAVEKFEKAYRSPKNAATPVPERVKRMRSMNAELGDLRVEDVIPGGEHGLTLVCKGEKGPVVVLDFIFDPDNGGRLEGAQVKVGGDDIRPRSVAESARREVIENACAALEEGYVFPEVGKKMAAHVREKLKAGGYDSIRSEGELARTLTDDFRSVSRDGHLRVIAEPQPARQPEPVEEKNSFAGSEQMMRKDNFSFRKVELLPGNIGYVRFDLFIDHPGARRAAEAAMALVKHADAIIFDMRYNGGGEPEFIQYISSYLFDEKTHLNDMVDRNGAVVDEYWTLGEIAAEARVASMPVYVLTSSYTFSGAEEFTYNLKNLKRATVVGETTGGGAHPVRTRRLNDRFAIGVPYMRAQNPITRTNWEGTGVEPDVKVKASEALDRAIELAKAGRAR